MGQRHGIGKQLAQGATLERADGVDEQGGGRQAFVEPMEGNEPRATNAITRCASRWKLRCCPPWSSPFDTYFARGTSPTHHSSRLPGAFCVSVADLC